MTGSLLDSASAWEGIRRLPEVGRMGTREGDPYALALRRSEDEYLRHDILCFPDWRQGALLSVHELALATLLARTLDALRPDALLIYGGFNYTRAALAMARRRGIRSAFYLASPTYRDRSVFEDADHILCVSQSLRDLLGLGDDPRVLVTGSLVDPARYRVADDARAPECVLFVNPSPDKGLSLFAALAALSEREGRAHRFLVVQSRGTWAQALRVFPDLARRDNIEVLPAQPEMRGVYARAWAVIFPSVWPEPSGRVPIEAGLNGIPVLAHDVGGVRETLPDGATLFEPPPDVIRDHRAPTPDAYARRWLDALDAMAGDPVLRAEQGGRARRAAASRDPEALIDRVEAMLAGR